MGQRDIPLNAEGVAQASAVAAALAPLPIADIIASPLIRAVQTAEPLGRRFGIQVARDPRLVDFRVGKWEGMAYDDVAASPEYQRFLADPMAVRVPGGESLDDVRARAVGALEQAIEDCPAGEAIAVVSHAGVIRVLLAHFAGSSPANYHRLRVSPGSISVLSFADDRDLPRVLAVNWRAGLGDLF